MSSRLTKALALITISCIGIAIVAVAITRSAYYASTSMSVKPSNATNAATAQLGAETSYNNTGPVGFAQLLPPLYRNVSAGDAWIFDGRGNGSGTGNGSMGLGARGLGCECFNPQNACCLPASTSLGPFCMPTGSICCGNTFCVEGETCCGGFCCAASTTCNLKLTGSGCCPQGTLCTGPATCYDHLSANCTSPYPDFSPKEQCCPTNLPYCRDFAPSGLGCYAQNTSTLTSSSPCPTSTTNISAAGISAAATTNMLASLLSAALLSSDEAVTVPSSTVTVTVSVVSNLAGQSSLLFPSLGSKVGGVSTTYVMTSPSAVSVTPAPSSSASAAAGPVAFTAGGYRPAVAELWIPFGAAVLGLWVR